MHELAAVAPHKTVKVAPKLFYECLHELSLMQRVHIGGDVYIMGHKITMSDAHCENCGAPQEANRATCAYCGT